MVKADLASLAVLADRGGFCLSAIFLYISCILLGKVYDCWGVCVF